MSRPFPARARHHALVRNALRNARDRAPLVAWGGPAAGKRSTVLAAAPAAARVAAVDCVRAHGDAALLRAVAGAAGLPAAAAAGGGGADAAAALVAALDARAAAGGRAVVLVLLRAERLAEAQFRPEVVAAVVSLGALVRAAGAVRVVLVSRLAWPALRDAAGLSVLAEPRCVWFAPYAEGEAAAAVAAMTTGGDGAVLPLRGDAAAAATARALAAAGRAADARALYPAFVRAAVAVLFTTSRDVRELARACHALYPVYLRPLVDEPGVAPAALWPRFEKHIAAAARMLYRRELALPRAGRGEEDGEEEGEEEEEEEEEDLVRDAGRAACAGWDATAAVAAMDLGDVAKRLLVAAYLAAANPPATDLHYFSAVDVRRRGRARRAARGKRRRTGAVAAAALPLNRIIAIFDAIQDVGNDVHRGGDGAAEPTAMSSGAFVHLASLVSLSLLARDAGGDALAEPKFRCNLPLDVAHAVAASVGVDLSAYLHVDAMADE